MDKPFKRRRYFIDKGVQARFIGGFAAACMAGGIVAIICFRYMAERKIEQTLYSVRLPDVLMGYLLMEEMLFTTVFTAFFVLILFAYTGRKLFVRIEGPLTRMAGVIRVISAGDLQTRVRLREEDEFKGFAREVDQMVVSLNTTVKAIKNRAHEAAEASRQSDCSAEGQEKLLKRLAALGNEVRGVRI